MNHLKISLANVLLILGALVFGFIFFLSSNFLTLGETIPSIIWGAVAALILGGLAYGAKLLKRTPGKFKTCKILEWVVLFLFVVSAFLAVFRFSHYFAVLDQKAEIQQKIISTITQAEGMFAEYESYANNRLNIYKSRLHSVVAGKMVNPTIYRDWGFVDSVDDNTQIDNKMFILSTQLYPSNYAEMKKSDSTWIADSKAKITDWSPLGVVEVINTVKNKIITWKAQLKEFSSFRAQGEIADDFEYLLAFDDTTDQISELGNPTLLSILCAMGLYILMLLTYFITKHHPRYPGLKVIFGTGGVKENEL